MGLYFLTATKLKILEVELGLTLAVMFHSMAVLLSHQIVHTRVVG